jgi:hypothetical protein
MSKFRKSVPIVWRDLIRESQIPRPGKPIGFALSTYMNHCGFAYPSRETLAAAAGYKSVRTVDEGIKLLESCALLEVSRSRGRSSNGYQALLPADAADLRRSEWATAQNQASNGAKSNGNRATVAPKSDESDESGTRDRGPFEEAAPHVLDDCMGCGRAAALGDTGDRLLCRACWSLAEGPT